MRRSVVCLALTMAFSPLAAAADEAPAAKRWAEANKMLESGQPGKALEAYRELMIEDPESPELHYCIGSARYREALKLKEAKAYADAREALQSAAESFDKAQRGAGGRVRADAEYNRANALAQQAKSWVEDAGEGMALQAPQEKDYEGVMEAFEESVQAYERFLDKYPDREDARANLDHMRYLLKKLMQNPPQEQEQDQQQQQDQQQDQKKDEQNEGEDQQKQQQQQQEQEQQQQSEQQDDERQSSGQDEQAESESSQEENEQAGQDDQDRQNVEAILESLEDLDQQEQKNRRQGPTDNRLRREWW